MALRKAILGVSATGVAAGSQLSPQPSHHGRATSLPGAFRRSTSQRSVRFACGHALVCEECANMLVRRKDKCPTCRTDIVIASRGPQIAKQATFVNAGLRASPR